MSLFVGWVGLGVLAMGLRVGLQIGAGEEFNVHGVGGGTCRGTVAVSFYGYPGSGHIVPAQL